MVGPYTVENDNYYHIERMDIEDLEELFKILENRLKLVAKELDRRRRENH